MKQPIMTFPELKNNDILECMKEIEIPCSLEDILHPTPNRIMAIYQHFLDTLMSHKSVLPSFNQMGGIENQELMSDSITLIGFYKVLNTLFSRVGVQQFGISDLLKPSSPRVSHIFSAVINFCKFREDRLEIYDECTKKNVT